MRSAGILLIGLFTCALAAPASARAQAAEGVAATADVANTGGSKPDDLKPTDKQPDDRQPNDRQPRDKQPRIERAVRLTYLAGAVSVQRSDNTAEDAPVLNMPLTEGTRLVAGDYGQAEFEFEDGSVVRLTPGSAVSLDALELKDGVATTHFTVLRGLVYAELRKAEGYRYRLDAGGMQVAPLENSTVRVKVEDPPAAIAVLTGSVRVEKADGFRTAVHAGEVLMPEEADAMRFALSHPVTQESWDTWNESRDQLAADQVDKRTTARDSFAGSQGFGWSDLDGNGSWYDVPGTGPVWQPNVADEGFDPYGYGSWVWSGQGGYVYASGYSWGWTPFRCGYWDFYPSFGWAWVPQRGCGNWGYDGLEGGLGGSNVRRGPPKYRPIRLPLPGPGKVHPILTVRGLDGARPPVLRGKPIEIGGVVHLPLKPVGGGSGRGSSTVGQGLDRDFPIDRVTGVPVLGLRAGRVEIANRPADQPVRHEPARGYVPAPGYLPPVQSGFPSGAGLQPNVPVVRIPIAPPATVPVVHTPMAPPAVVPRPVQPPQPIRQPQPVYSQPVRVAPAPQAAPAPARADTAKPSPK